MPRSEKKSKKDTNAYIHFSKEFYRGRDTNSTTKAADLWNNMPQDQKFQWYKLQNLRKLMNIIKKNKKLLNKSSYELIVSTLNSFDSPFIIEPESLMAGLAMEMLAMKKNGDIPNDEDEDYAKILEEFIHLDRCS
ncbi:unnamed protein product [Rhizophagus irregularis]|uniref:Uncharacterized protein n=1 Tax=Rhizophagus irregularis TaxID=588596 RepID=A0A2N1MZ53_9GLOM|nr:hypothetical protein RhiirC2_852588 [Rhizophagus irregularis]CAB4398008.1 unnamed protein product [Rhizophagus irregularis]CAB5377467.1 unnamed protein product [Rhizophagus irregularis]